MELEIIVLHAVITMAILDSVQTRGSNEHYKSKQKQNVLVATKNSVEGMWRDDAYQHYVFKPQICSWLYKSL